MRFSKIANLLKSTLFISLFLTSLFITTSCNKEEGELIEQQYKAYIDYLTRKEIPFIEQYGTIKEILTESTRGTLITSSSKVEMFFAAYIAGSDVAFYTNILTIAESSGLPTVDSGFDFTPLLIDLSSKGVLSGLRSGLLDSREGEVLNLYLTSNLAYGKKGLGLVPGNSPIVYYIEIISVK